MLKLCVLAGVAATAFAQPEITSSNGAITMETAAGVNVARRQQVIPGRPTVLPSCRGFMGAAIKLGDLVDCFLTPPPAYVPFSSPSTR